MSKIFCRIFCCAQVIVVIVLTQMLTAQPPVHYELNVKENYQRSEKNIFDIYHRILRDHRRDTAFVKNLLKAQVFWSQSSDAQITVHFPEYPNLKRQNRLSSAMMAYKRQLNDARIKELSFFLDTISAPLRVIPSSSALEWSLFADAVPLAAAHGKYILVTFQSTKLPADWDMKQLFDSSGILRAKLKEYFIPVNIDLSFMEYRKQYPWELLGKKIATIGSDPHFAYFDSSGDLIWMYSGTLSDEEIIRTMGFISGGFFMKQSYADYCDDLIRAANNTTSVRWRSYNEGREEASRTGKKILINAHAYWSPYCVKMKKYTYSDRSIMAAIESLFVPIQIEPVDFYKARIRYNDSLVNEYTLLNKTYNVQGYPSTVFCMPNGDLIGTVPGFHQPEVFRYVLKYYDEDMYSKEDIHQYFEHLGMKDALK